MNNNEHIINMLNKIIIDLKSNKYNEQTKFYLYELILKFKFLNGLSTNSHSQGDLIKFLCLGWHVYENISI